MWENKKVRLACNIIVLLLAGAGFLGLRKRMDLIRNSLDSQCDNTYLLVDRVRELEYIMKNL